MYTGSDKFTETADPGAVAGGPLTATTVLLPVPSYLAGPLKEKIALNGNIALVKNAAEADYVLFLNYALGVGNKEDELVFFYHPPLDVMPRPLFTLYSFSIAAGLTGEAGLDKTINGLYKISTNAIRYKNGEAWLAAEKKK